jgi:hypothetical protein
MSIAEKGETALTDEERAFCEEVPDLGAEYFVFTETAVDIRVVFVELGEFAGNKWLGDVKQRVGVTMSWPTAKMLCVDLRATIKEAEWRRSSSGAFVGELTGQIGDDDVRSFFRECPRELYSNHILFSEAAFGVRAVFGRLSGPLDTPDSIGVIDTTADAEPQLVVRMLWPLVEMLCARLSVDIDGYESVNGEIKTDLLCPFAGAHKVRAPERPM